MGKSFAWGLAALLAGCVAVSASASADVCATVNPEAHLPRPGEENYEARMQLYGNKCTLEDFDHGQMDYYTKSQARCRAIPGFIDWVKDTGSGHNLCVFEPPSDGAGGGSSGGGSGSGEGASGGDGYDSGAAPAPPPKPAVDHGSYTVKFCNKHNAKIFLAVALYENPEDEYLTVQGWWLLKSDECATFARRLGKYASHKIAFYAETKKKLLKREHYWGGNVQLCVQSDAFTRRNTAGYSCSGSERLVGFQELTVKKGTLTQNLR